MWTVPNLLTLARAVAAPFVLLAFALAARPLADWIAFLLFVGAAVTDWADGRLARAWGQHSAFGRMLDPIADKAIAAMALAALLSLHGPHPLLALPAAAILLRETLVSGLREFLKGDAALSVTPLAKWKTAAQLAALSTLLAAPPAETLAAGAGAAVEALGLALLWVAAVLTVVTGWGYLAKGAALIGER